MPADVSSLDRKQGDIINTKAVSETLNAKSRAWIETENR
jgi:hypothetical protein